MHTEITANFNKKLEGRLLIFSGINRRYKFIVNRLIDRYSDAALVVQHDFKGDYKGKYDADLMLDKDVVRLINSHLEKRDAIEALYYTDDTFHLSPKSQTLHTDYEHLNDDEVVEFIQKSEPSLVFVFGVGMLKKSILDACNRIKMINLHFGLTPYYRGSDTLLWPLYLQHPDQLGFTLHEIDAAVDNGPIYHQQKTCFLKGDSIHDIFCKTIIQAAEPVNLLIDLLMSGRNLKPYVPKVSGKLFLKGEFTPNHLKIIYHLIEKRLMLEKYLDGKWPERELKLYSCLEK